MSVVPICPPSDVASTLTSRVSASLQDDITFGVLPPGAKLKIEMLQQRYSCGATPVREALGLLCNTGLVQRIEQRGFRVTPVSLDDYAELMRTRCFLEAQALREAIDHGDSAWEERIVVAQFHLRREERGPDQAEAAAWKDWEARHAVFHAALIAACPGRRLLAFCTQLYAESDRYRFLARGGSGRRSGSYEEHRRIADAVLSRDSDRAVHCLMEHYRRTAELLHAAPEPATPSPGPDAAYGRIVGR